MKRFSATLILLIITSVILFSCASDSFVLVYYENYALVSDSLSFTLKKVPNEEHFTIFAAMDGKLGQIEYEILNETGEPLGTLIYRQASLDYATKFRAQSDTFGISGKQGSASSSERIGSYEVSYSTDANVAVAVWDEDEYSYSLVFSFSDEETTATTAEVREYAISLISTR